MHHLLNPFSAIETCLRCGLKPVGARVDLWPNLWPHLSLLPQAPIHLRALSQSADQAIISAVEGIVRHCLSLIIIWARNDPELTDLSGA
jgi:hypothetical protein